MNTKEQIIANIEANKELMKQINKVNYFAAEDFYNNAVAYINAVREGRMLCTIPKVRLQA